MAQSSFGVRADAIFTRRSKFWVAVLLFVVSYGQPAWAARGPLPQVPLDLSNATELTLALQLRATADKQVILFSFCQGEQACPADQPYCHVVQYMAESLILHLEKMGYDHYIALACSAELCGRLHASWPAGAPPPSCAFSSEPSRSAPLAGLDTDWQRYLALSHVAERGYDALLIETDFAFHHDIYPLLRAPPLDAFQIVALKAGHHADSGAIYVRGSKCHQDGAALWVLRDVHRRKRVAYEAMEADDKKRDPLGIAGHDQQILTAALRIASSPGGSEHDWRDLHRHVADTEEHRSSPLWGALPPQDDGSLGGPLSEFAWDESEERYGMPDPSCPSADPQECARWARFVDELRFVDAQLASKEICVPRDSHRYREGVPCERVAAGFPWVWQHGNILRFGWRNASAASHLLGMNIGWGDKGTSSGGLSGRLAWLVANGYADERVIPSPPEGKVLVMDPNERLWKEQGIYPAPSHAKFLLKTHSEDALRRGLVPVFTHFSCESKWVQRSNVSRSGILDHRVLETPDGRCYPSPAEGGCFTHIQFMYDFMLGHTSSERVRMLVKEDDWERECSEFMHVEMW